MAGGSGADDPTTGDDRVLPPVGGLLLAQVVVWSVVGLGIAVARSGCDPVRIDCPSFGSTLFVGAVLFVGPGTVIGYFLALGVHRLLFGTGLVQRASARAQVLVPTAFAAGAVVCGYATWLALP